MKIDTGPRFYFSFRSPYSWLAAHYVQENCEPERTGLVYIPFWEPDDVTLAQLRACGGEFLYTPMSHAKHLYILQDLRRLTSALGRRVVWPVDVKPWWDLPHLAYLAARRNGKGREFFWAAYRARWEEGRDICAPDTIRSLALEVGLAPDVLASAPEDPDIRSEGAAALYECYRDGVFGVPFFTHKREQFWGFDRVAAFADALRGAPPAARTSDAAPSPWDTAARRDGMPLPVFDVDHAGGCG